MTSAELLERMNRFQPPTGILLGMELLELDIDAGRVKVKYQPGPEFTNPMGSVQGGIVVAMLDDAAAFAAIAKSGTRISVPSVELKTSFFAPVKAGVPVYAEGRCIKLGKRIAFMEADLTDGDGKLLARLTTSAVPVEIPPGGGNLVERSEHKEARS
jgi:uncharacterized protein (TIGR00369 family)